MDFKDSNVQKIALAVIAFFIVTYFWYTRLYTHYDSQITHKSQEFETITTELRNVEMKAKSLDALKGEYTDLLDRYHEIEALLPEVKQIPSFLVQLHMASSLTGTKITKVTPGELSSDQFYNVASFEIELQGGFHELGRFISYVANFPFITNVSDMKVTAKNVAIIGDAPEDKMRLRDFGKTSTLTAAFTLSTYFVREDERLSELVL